MTHPASLKVRRGLRLAGWNAAGLLAGLVLVGLAGEAWLRATVPFKHRHYPTAFVPEVGFLLRPDTEVRWTNNLDFWTLSRSNSLGFLDREPPNPERAAASCHIAVIGDSFVDARHVPIADKLQVRLERLAARELPHLNVTTSAFGMPNIGQVSQLPFYDEYARRLRPKLVVLVFVPNDFIDNFPLWTSLRTGMDPEHLPYAFASRAEDGGLRLHPPDPSFQRFMLPRLADSPAEPQPLSKRAAGWLLRESYFWRWLHLKHSLLFFQPDVRLQAQRVAWMELLRRRPAYAPLLDGWRPVSRGNINMWFANEETPSFFALFQEGYGSPNGLPNDSSNGPPFLREALAHTAFGLDEFKKRAERDGAALAILATHRMRRFGGGAFARMSAMAEERGIPVIDQAALVRRQGAELRDAQFPHNGHWNPAGHQWAAEALLEYLKENQDVCGGSALGSEAQFASPAGRGLLRRRHEVLYVPLSGGTLGVFASRAFEKERRFAAPPAPVGSPGTPALW